VDHEDKILPNVGGAQNEEQAQFSIFTEDESGDGLPGRGSPQTGTLYNNKGAAGEDCARFSSTAVKHTRPPGS